MSLAVETKPVRRNRDPLALSRFDLLVQEATDAFRADSSYATDVARKATKLIQTRRRNRT